MTKLNFLFYNSPSQPSPSRGRSKCAALSLAALKDFVCEANGTNIHFIKAMPLGSAEIDCVFFFCLLLQLRALLETCKMASLSERFTFSSWLFAFYEFQSIARRQYSSLYAHNPLFSSQQKRKSEHIKI